MYLSDRHEAGRRLAGLLGHLAEQDPLVLGLPRGGVPVAAEVARLLGAPLDVVMARKMAVPGQDELTMGAIGDHGVRVVNEAVLHATDTTEAQWDQVEAVERMDLARRARLYRSGREPEPLSGRLAIIVDDGLHTGSTARAACLAARAAGAGRIVLAVPVAPRGWTTRLADVADELVCLDTPHEFTGIDQFYGDFTPVTDEDVVGYLQVAARRRA
ncbi:phosphoribosyltransferase [Catenulispora subtropica]|uniref:Phosphoribosyltransferase domain-containing protein n=1 Tax=Catenulispora subtropica TaxID=450798 RepID=A0ABN2RN99_9ACTN